MLASASAETSSPQMERQRAIEGAMACFPNQSDVLRATLAPFGGEGWGEGSEKPCPGRNPPPLPNAS